MRVVKLLYLKTIFLIMIWKKIYRRIQIIIKLSIVLVICNCFGENSDFDNLSFGILNTLESHASWAVLEEDLATLFSSRISLLKEEYQLLQQSMWLLRGKCGKN